MKKLLLFLLITNICQAMEPLYKSGDCFTAKVEKFYEVVCEDAIFKAINYTRLSNGIVYISLTYYKNVQKGCPDFTILEADIIKLVTCPKDFK